MATSSIGQVVKLDDKMADTITRTMKKPTLKAHCPKRTLTRSLDLSRIKDLK